MGSRMGDMYTVHVDQLAKEHERSLDERGSGMRHIELSLDQLRQQCTALQENQEKDKRAVSVLLERFQKEMFQNMDSLKGNLQMERHEWTRVNDQQVRHILTKLTFRSGNSVKKQSSKWLHK